jgi:tetratricopeptide (TPR) repeat protein
MSANSKLPDENPSSESLESQLADWESRKRLAHLLYDQGAYLEAADAVWGVKEIPNIDIELAFAARILAKAAPRKAIRLLTALLEHNRGKAVQNLGLANALLHHGMVLQAARFYGAALEADPSLGNPELEHFILWTDDEEKLWGDFKRRRPQLGELPWMRDEKMAMSLTNKITLHTTPIMLPNLEPSANEELKNPLYLQEARKGMQPTPPPAVTIPLDRVDPKHRRFDSEVGAPTTPQGQPVLPVGNQPTNPDSAAGAPPKPPSSISGGTLKPNW